MLNATKIKHTSTQARGLGQKPTGFAIKSAGFTLIEILLVLTLLGLVFTIVGRRIIGGLGRGKKQATSIMIKQLEGDLDRYRLDCNAYPKSPPGGPGLRALIENPGATICPNWDPQGYRGGSKKMPQDAWSNEFQYSCDDGQNYVIKSLGADNAEGGEGENADISSADEK